MTQVSNLPPDRSKRSRATRAILLLLPLVLAACTGSDDEVPESTAAATTSSTPVTTSTPAPSSTLATTSTSVSSTTLAATTKPTEPETQKKRPPNVTAKLKQKTFQYRPSESGPATRIRVIPTIMRGSQKDLAEYRMDALSSTQVPWFVELRVRNMGEGALQRPSFTKSIIARNGQGDHLDNVVLSRLDQCQHADGPRRFNKNSKPVVQCRVFFVPRGQRLASISFRNVKGNRVDWKVPQRIGDKANAPKPGNAGPAGKWVIQGEPRTVNWRHGSIGLRANIRPVSVVKGKKADVSGYGLDAADKLTTPWYVSVSSKHVGKRRAADVPDFEHWTVAYNEKNQRITGVVILGPFPKCKDTPKPKGFGPKSQPLKSCAVFLVPDGQRIARVGMVHNDDSEEVNWKVTRP